MYLRATLLLALLAGSRAADRPGYEEVYEDLPPNYQFKYEVKDEYTGQEFGQEEARSGYNTDGEYSVVLPDGRRQIVSYRVGDGDHGFVADVRYEGEPDPSSYGEPSNYRPTRLVPDYNPKPVYNPKPAYKPEPKPAYRPEPVYKPEPAYKPRQVYRPKPAYRPKPTYGPRARNYNTPVPETTYGPENRPSYVATTAAPYVEPVTEAYRPVPRTYGPARKPAYAPTSIRPHRPTVAKIRARQPISSYKQVDEVISDYVPEVDNVVEVATEAPVYNPRVVKKRRMKYANRLKASPSNTKGSLFYGNVKGRVKKPKRIRADPSEAGN